MKKFLLSLMALFAVTMAATATEVTITATTDIDSISFNWEKQGDKTFATATANCGTYTHPTKAGKGVWKKDANNPTKEVMSVP